MFEVGDKVVYPHHGAGKIVKKEVKEILGQRREYLTIQILYNEMTVMVPTENADKAGLRRVIDEEAVEQVLAVLRDDGSQMPKNWNRRFKHNRDKIKTGDIFELAEVVRNLSIRDLDKGLSTGEKQMFGRAKKILASELMYARDMEEQEATEFLDNLLEEIGRGRAANGRSVPSVPAPRWPPGCLADAGAARPRADLLVAVLRAVSARYRALLSGGPSEVIDAFTRYDHLLGRTVTVALDGGTLTGTASGIDPLGRLRLAAPDGERRLAAGEVVRVGG